MKRLALVGIGCLTGLLLLAGCNKPSDDACKKAIVNIKHLHNTDNLSDKSDLDGEIRRCRGGSTREAVDCAGAAQTLDELNKCAFNKDKGGEEAK